MGMSFMRNSRGFMIRVSIEMLIRKRLEIRFGIGAEEGNSSVSSSYVLDRKILIHQIEILAIEGSIESRENMRKIIEKILDIWYDVM